MAIYTILRQYVFITRTVHFIDMLKLLKMIYMIMYLVVIASITYWYIRIYVYYFNCAITITSSVITQCVIV